ncbi:MAG: DNA-processing protein DprA [Microbacterium sp.]|uniref:DNA-processing protein DprA n=1 Tax=Microbacterium sp. TaxID=51671 RepID=UPI0039E6A2C7
MTVLDPSDPAWRDRAAAVCDRPANDGLAEELVARAMWSCLVEPGDRVAGQLVDAHGAVVAVRAVQQRAPDPRVPRAAGIGGREWTAALERWRPRMAANAVVGALETAARSGIRLLVPGDERWPAALRDLGDHAPLCLWVRGRLEAMADAKPAVALVGARAASGYGEYVAVDLAAELASRGVAIVSGAAYGIDGAAHRAALAAGGLTVALLAGGADRPYPAGNTNLIERIAASGGAVVSEAPCGGTPTKWRFLQRNRLISALAGAVVVVEAGWRSGSLNTAHHAAELGRPLGAVPGPITSAASAGCHRLLRENDATCVTGADDVMEMLGATPPSRRVEGSPRTDDRTRVLDALGPRAPRSVTEVARRSGMSVADAEGLLGLLSLEGRVESIDRGWRLAGSRPRSPRQP